MKFLFVLVQLGAAYVNKHEAQSRLHGTCYYFVHYIASIAVGEQNSLVGSGKNLPE